jgi:tRNA pseudouridine38-40 synthase
MKILLTISYVGTNYFGYQLQEDKPTVALMLNKAVKKTFGFDCNVTGCSRTDSGVHAIGYCLSVDPVSENDVITVPVEKIPIALNTALPKDICVVSAKEVPDSFHPRYDVVRKEYVYRIRVGEIRDPFLCGKVMELGKKADAISVEKMEKAARDFIGTYDFSSFMASGSKIKDATRTVFESEITKRDDIIEYRVSADGFLYNMVRIMVGTLVEIGLGKRDPDSIPAIISSRDRKNAGKTAPPDGLYLNKVLYEI